MNDSYPHAPEPLNLNPDISYFETPKAVLLAEAVIEKRKLAGQIKKLDELIDGYESDLLAEWSQNGTQSMTVNTDSGRMNLYTSVTLWGKVDPLGELDTDAIRDSEHGYLLTVNWSKVAGLLRDLSANRDEGALEQLASFGILPDERTRINVRKA